MARKEKLNPRALPLDGVIQGGPLNGWSYLFMGFAVSPRALVLRAVCCAPKWPFPHEIRLDEDLLGDLVEAGPVPLARGQREKFEPLRMKQRYVPLENEIEAAYRVAEIDPPRALIWAQSLSLRDLLLRVNEESGDAH